MKAGLVATLTPLAGLILVALTLARVSSALLFPGIIASVAAGVVLARRLIARSGFEIAWWVLGAGFFATALPAFRAGAVGIAAGWLLVSTALIRLASKRTTKAPDPSVSEL
jgi:hypothetical protein